MKCFFYFLSVLLLLSSCASAPPRQLLPFADERPPSLQKAELQKKCAAAYPQGKWQFVHAIEFRMADGRGSSVVGVTVVDGTTLSCALMTIEGFTLFEARLGDQLEVQRAVPPFDNPAFVVGLMDDVRAFFIRPRGQEIQYGRLVDDTESCRITGADGEITEILPSADGCWQMNTYNADTRLTRAIRARFCRSVDSVVIPGELKLTVPDPAGYTLKMTLITAGHGNNPSPALSSFLFPGQSL